MLLSPTGVRDRFWTPEIDVFCKAQLRDTIYACYTIQTSYHITSHHITPHHITSHHTTSHHITSHHITSHHITPHHITSHHTTLLSDQHNSLNWYKESTRCSTIFPSYSNSDLYSHLFTFYLPYPCFLKIVITIFHCWNILAWYLDTAAKVSALIQIPVRLHFSLPGLG